MPPSLTLEDLVRRGGFRSRRHRGLLDTAPALPWPQLAALQSAYAATDHELERRAIGVAFERAVRELAEDDDEQNAREAEQREFDALFEAPPVLLDLEHEVAELDRWHLAVLVLDGRRGGRTWRDVAQRLDVSVGRARRLLAWLERGTAPRWTATNGGPAGEGRANEEDQERRATRRRV